jgi:hypothetical protein
MLYNYNEYRLMVNEGLIKTHNIDNSISILDMNLNLFKISYNIIKLTDNVFEVEFLDKINIDLIDNVLIIVNNTGYFPSYIFLNTNNIKYKYKFNHERLENNLINKNIIYIKIRFESKFDKEIINNFEYLYHVCNKQNLNKILKIGLVPKSKNKITSHPERIYLLQNINDAYRLIKKFEFNDLVNNIKNEYIILKIKINNNIKLYNDPNHDNVGYYTYENIHKNDIEILI